MSEAEIFRDFPDLTQEDIRVCLAFSQLTRSGNSFRRLPRETAPRAEPRAVYRSRALWPSIPAPSTFETGLQAADDDVVWTYAAEHGFVIASKDTDFHQRSFVLGHPPKVLEQRACTRARLA